MHIWGIHGNLRKVAKQPSPQTLRRYGLSVEEWAQLNAKQRGVCAICGKLPPSGKLNIDHEHVRNWKKLPPEKRKLYVRCLACTFCNRVVIRKGVTIDKMKRAIEMLEEYEKRKAKNK